MPNTLFLLLLTIALAACGGGAASGEEEGHGHGEEEGHGGGSTVTVSPQQFAAIEGKLGKVEMKDLNSGTWNLDAGLGIDLTIFSVEGGASYGLSKAYKEQEGITNDARFVTYYFTVGVILGGSTRGSGGASN